MRLSLLALGVLLSAHAFAITKYEQIASSFAAAAQPTHKHLSGYWIGRCLDREAPDTLLPAIFVHRLVDDHAEFPPTRPSFTYYRDKTLAATAYDHLTPAGIEARPELKDWFAREQWQAIKAIGGSLVNYFVLATGERIERAARVYEDEFNKMVLLRITRQDSVGSAVVRYCYYGKHVGEAPIDDLDPVTSDYLLGHTGPVHNQWVEAKNPRPEVSLRSFRVINNGKDVRILDTRVFLIPGPPSTTIAGFTLPMFGSSLISMADKLPFRATGLEFYVKGATKDLEIQAVPWGSVPRKGDFEITLER